MAEGYLGLRQLGARPRARDGVRGGGLPQHLRVLGRRHGHLHDQRVPLHPGLRVLPGRHPPPAPARPRRARPGGRGRRPDGPGPRRDHLCRPGRPGRRGGRGVRRRPSPPSGGRVPGTAVEVLISDVKGDRGVAPHHPRCPARRAQPQHRDGGPAAACGPAVRRIRPEPDGAGPFGRGPGSRPSRASSSAWASGRTRCSPPWPTCGPSGSTSSPWASTCARAPATSRSPAGGRRRSSTACAGPGMALGFAHVQASPLTRSSYHAREAADASTGSASAPTRAAPSGPVPVPVTMSVR